MEQDVMALAEAAARTEAGARLLRRLTINAALGTMAPEAKDEIARGTLEAQDGGEAMAVAYLDELSPRRRQTILDGARELATRRLVDAARDLAIGAEIIGLPIGEVPPAAVAVLAARTR